MLEALKQQVYEANMELPSAAWLPTPGANVSGIDGRSGLFCDQAEPVWIMIC